ncbi:MAG: hypothetical protein RO257_17140 [Candidatus Kapabacteria bacterium]|nr:hypothetical protein [Candidatus Kapabacteria bacterium]
MDIRICYLVVIFAISINVNLSAQENKKYTPLELSELVYGSSGFDYNKVLPFCCDMHSLNFKDSTFGQLLPADTKRSFSLIYQDDTSAVTSISLKIADESMDIYFYFTKLEDWHIETLRTLARTDMIKKTLMEIEKLPFDSAMKVISVHGYTDLDKYIKRNKLLLSSDDEIADYFRSNYEKFNEIAEYIIKNDFINHEKGLDFANSDSFVKQKLDSLLIDRIVPAEEGNVFEAGFLIGGILDNTAGYFYQPDTLKVPPINKLLYIIIKPLGNGWYMYKTT